MCCSLISENDLSYNIVDNCIFEREIFCLLIPSSNAHCIQHGPAQRSKLAVQSTSLVCGAERQLIEPSPVSPVQCMSMNLDQGEASRDLKSRHSSMGWQSPSYHLTVTPKPISYPSEQQSSLIRHCLEITLGTTGSFDSILYLKFYFRAKLKEIHGQEKCMSM